MAGTLIPPGSELESVIEAARKEVNYLVTDFALETLVSKFKEDPKEEGDIYIPDYQRTLVWKADKMSYLVESLILRIPVPPVFFYDVDGRLEIVDGSQRIRSLVSFLNNEFSLRDLEKLDILNGLRFADLPPTIRRRFLNTPIRSFVLDQSTDESTRIDLFRRLNTSGKKLEDSEIRKGAFRGIFLNLVLEAASSEAFKNALPRVAGDPKDPSERQELVTRFFIYSDFYQEFRHDVRRFLDERMVHLNKTASEQHIARMKAEFDKAMTFIFESAPSAFYRTKGSKVAPRVRFEAIAVGTNLALRKNPNLKPKPYHWLESEEFKALVRTDASNSGPRLRSRIEYVEQRLLSI